MLELLDGFHRATAGFWHDQGLMHAPVPLTTGSISSPMGLGSDSSPLAVEIADQRTFLADSQQFALEALCRVSPRGCWYIMESFRGEPNDARHLGQFLHSEVEVPGGLDDVIALAERYLRHVAATLLRESSAAILSAAGTTAHLEAFAGSRPWLRMSFDEAAQELRDAPGAVTAEEGFRVLTVAGERELTRRAGEPLWITGFDELAVPFYQASDERADGRRARNADLLLGGMEVLGAGERHASADALAEALRRHGVSAEPYVWYIEMRQRRPLQTAGFGLGVERFLLWVLAHDDIRDLRLLLRSHGEDLHP